MVWAFCAVLLAVMLAASGLCYRVVFKSPNTALGDPYAVPPGDQYERVADEMLQNIRQLDALPYEQVFITGWDGTLLGARYYHFHNDAPVQIFFHGYRSNALREFACGYQLAQKLGYNALVVDQRAHGSSGGHTITFGIRERYDCLDWCNYIADRFGKNAKVFLSGISMGGATVLMASNLELPDNVRAITADCAYASPGKIIRKITRDMKLPGWLAYPLVLTGALVFGGFRIWESSAIRSVREARIPILLIHGDDDRFVPWDMSRAIYDACNGDKKLVIVPTAGHGLSCLTDPLRYEKVMARFLMDCGIPIKQ